MKGCNLWSYSPYRPFLIDVGDIYVCRLAPTSSSIHLEWLSDTEGKFEIYYRSRGEGDFIKAGETYEHQFDIKGLECDCDFELYVRCGEVKSRIRLARVGEGVGVTVNYLHPDDECYKFSGRYICSPSMVKHPDGYLLASMDLYAQAHPQNLTLIFRSDDDGESWYYQCELMPCFWGKLFIHRGEIYMLACSTEYGDLLISKSTDGAKTFSAPVSILRGTNGKLGNVGVHKNQQNPVIYNGRLYHTIEWGSWGNRDFPYRHAAMVISCDIDADLLNPESWHITPPVIYNPDWEGVTKEGEVNGNIEGTLVISPDGKLYNVMRYESDEKKVIAYEVNGEDPDAPLTFSHVISFPANRSKFMIKRDERSGLYYSVATRRIDEPRTRRNLLSLMVSRDLAEWNVVCDLIDRRNSDPEKIGFQYVDFEFDGEDIIYLCRTAINGANSFHDSNYITFHRIKNFRNI